MKPEELPDWRIYFAAHVRETTGGSGSNRPKPGDLLVPIAEIRLPTHARVWIPRVSPYRLALSIAIRSAHEAVRLYKEIEFTKQPKGSRSKHIDYTTLPALFDYFEECMTAATFSYQAVETYSNQIIEQTLDDRTFSLERRKEPKEFDAEGLQREISTAEKIATVLPMLLDKPSPKSKAGALWQAFTILRHVRDSTIHLKSKDDMVRGAIDRGSVFYRLLNNQPRRYPRTAMDLMRHFAGDAELSWLDCAEAMLTQRA